MEAELRSIDRAFMRSHAIGEPGPTVARRYQLLAVIGSGGSGRVYRARDLELDRDVAIKVLSIAGDGGRHRREGQALARLAHPNVVQIFDHGIASDFWFIVLELLDGRPLDVWLREAERPPEEVVRVFVEAGRGLAAAHRARLLHRDFKPSNVIVTKAGKVVVVDFGLARGLDDLEDSGETAQAGTLRFMAPERLVAQPADEGSDQFSFCVALWESLTGTNPFAGEDTTQRFASIFRGPRGTVPLPRRAQLALRRGLSARASDRHASMEALLAELDVSRDAERGVLPTPMLVAALVGLMFAIVLGLMPLASMREATATNGSMSPHTTMLMLAEDRVRRGEHARALDMLEAAWSRASLREHQRAAAEAAMRIANEMDLAGDRVSAAHAYALAHEAFLSLGDTASVDLAAARLRDAMAPTD